MSEEVSRDDAARVLRRAAELSTPTSPDTVDRRALQEAAEEVGLSATAVRNALAELDAGALVPTPSRGLLGPSRVRVTRTVPVAELHALDRVRRWLRSQTFEPYERTPSAETWRRRGDLVAKVRRIVDLRGRVRLTNADAVRVSVAAVDDRSCVVHLEADFDAMRRGLLAGLVVLPAGAPAVLGGVLAIVTGDALFALGGIPVGAAFGGMGLAGGRRTLADERDAARRVFELLLDDLA